MKQNNINNNNKNKNYMESMHLCQGCRGTTTGQFTFNIGRMKG